MAPLTKQVCRSLWLSTQALQGELKEDFFFFEVGAFTAVLQRATHTFLWYICNLPILYGVTKQVLYRDTDPTLQHLDVCILKRTWRSLSFQLVLTPIFSSANYQILKNSVSFWLILYLTLILLLLPPRDIPSLVLSHDLSFFSSALCKTQVYVYSHIAVQTFYLRPQSSHKQYTPARCFCVLPEWIYNI